MELKAVLDLCQGTHIGEWRKLPGGGPVHRLITGLVDLASSDEPPALAALQHYHRAVYASDVSVGLAWGMDDEDWRERRSRGEEQHEWLPKSPGEIKSARTHYAHVLYNGAVVWEVPYVYADWGSGIGGCLPQPRPRFDGDATAPQIVAWEASTWDNGFAALLTDLQGESDFHRMMDAEKAGMTLIERHPLWDE